MGSVRTDVSPLDAIAIGAAMLRSPGDPDHMVIDTQLASETTGVDGAYLLIASPALKPAVAQFLAAPSLASTSVEVLNGAGVTGLAARTADKLSQAGFVIAGIADAPRAQTQTSIVARPAARAAAEQLASALGLPTSRVSTNSSLSTADIQVTLGSDAR
jgi:hypothetical protein